MEYWVPSTPSLHHYISRFGYNLDMRNQDIARIFENIADLLEIKGGDVYRVRAYRKAASVIESQAEPLEEIARRRELERIPGVGESIAEKIRDILETGTTPYYEALKAQYPESLAELLHIPNIGPRTAKRLYDKLGITSVEELRQAAKEHRISKAHDLGPEMEATVLKGLELYERRSRRLSLGIALPLAEEVVDRLKQCPQVGRICPAGSLRRRRETIGDIDIVVETSDPASVSRAFVQLPQVREVIETGPSMVSVWTRHGLRMDLRFSDTEHFGALLHHFTGGKMHNLRLRGMARDAGLSISEYGVTRLGADEVVTTGRTEDDIYGALGLPWIPPELREDRGEIEAAMENRLPRLVEIDDLHGDLHMHTQASDGADTIEDMVEAAKARGYCYVAICDHSEMQRIAHGMPPEKLLAQIERVRTLNRRLKDFRVLIGAEVDIRKDGSLDYDASVLERLDIVVASIHQRYKMSREQMAERIVRALSTGMVDIFAHPTGRLISSRPPYEVEMDRVFEAALAKSVALEINCNPDRLDLNDIYVRAAKERGIKLSIDTDAHGTEELANIRYGLAMARRGWAEPSDVINARQLDALLDWLHSRGSRLRAAA